MLPISNYIKKKEEKGSLSQGSIKVKLIFIAVFFLTGLIFTQLVFANNLATDGQKLSAYQEEIKNLEYENATIKAEIALKTSLTNLSKKAADLGFKKPSKLTIL